VLDAHYPGQAVWLTLVQGMTMSTKEEGILSSAARAIRSALEPSAEPDSSDAIDLLKADHKRVKKLFEQFDSAKDDDRTGLEELVAEICLELTVHTQIEEEIFYPAVRLEIDDDALMDEALVEHSGAKELIAQLNGMSADDEFFDARVKVLSELIDHHVEEEEDDMFPEVKKANVDTETLGAEMAARKVALMGGDLTSGGLPSL
jgi:hemerythrin superfamily protein